MMSAYHHVESSATHYPPPGNTYNVQIPDASKPPSLKMQFGINSMNHLVSQMPDHPVLNIQCQPREDIKTAIQLLFQWTLYKRTQDSTLTGQQLAGQIIAGLSGLANDWCR